MNRLPDGLGTAALERENRGAGLADRQAAPPGIEFGRTGFAGTPGREGPIGNI